MASIKLDIYARESLAATLYDLTGGLDVTFDETGVYAAGGNPEIEFTGPAIHLAVVIARYAGDDLDTLRDLLSQLPAADVVLKRDPEMEHTLAGN